MRHLAGTIADFPRPGIAGEQRHEFAEGLGSAEAAQAGSLVE
jgi:hypothetical protein